MALYKLDEFDPNYKDAFEDNDVKGMSVYSRVNDEKIGSVSDVLVDDEGHFRYFVVDLGFWIFGKKVLLPVGRSRVDHGSDRVYVDMTRDQAEHLPEFSERMAVDYDYEERVRGVYRQPSMTTSTGVSSTPVDTSTPLEASLPLEASAPLDGVYQPVTTTPTPPPVSTPSYATTNRETYNYQQDASLYDMNEQDHQTLRLYEERLIANKRRQKTGEVAIGKHVETETARVAVPVEKERVVIERVTPTDAGMAVKPGEATFREGEVAHMEIYEETPDIRKEAVVREEVRVRKVVEQDTVEAQETIRREELDIDTAGGLDIDQR